MDDIIKNRASRVITESFRNWLQYRETPCHTVIEHEGHIHMCISDVRARFNSFDKSEFKSLLISEYLSIRFDNMLNEINVEVRGDAETLEDDDGYKQMLYDKIIMDFFNDVNFDEAYVDDILDHDIVGAFDDGRTSCSVLMAILHIYDMLMGWNCRSICDAIERATGDKHTMIELS